MKRMRFYDRLSFRLALAVAVFTITAFVATGLLQIRSERNALTAELTRRVLAEASSMAVAVSNPLLRHDPELELHPLIVRTLSEMRDIEDIVVVDDRGLIQGHRELRRIGTHWDGDLPGAPLVIPGLPEDQNVHADGHSISLSVPIIHLDRQVGTLVMRAGTEGIQRAVWATTRRLAMIAGVGTLLAAVFVVLLVARSLGSLGHLRQGVEAIGAGRLRTRIDVRGRDELALLAHHINTMAGNLHEAQAELLIKERMTHELEIARELQSMLLPGELPRLLEYDLAATYEAALEVSGDYYDVVRLADGTLLLVTADVSGKGVPGLVLMAMLRVIIRGLAQPGRDPAQILIGAQRMLEGSMRRNMFITCFVGLLDPSTHRLRYASAGHCAPIRFNGSGQETLPARGKALGMFDEETFHRSLHPRETTLDVGDSILIYTDGLVEALNDRGELLGEDAVKDCFQAGQTPQQSIDALLERIRRHRAGAAASDDLTLLVLHRRAPASRGLDIILEGSVS